jgi:hypothetical protein
LKNVAKAFFVHLYFGVHERNEAFFEQTGRPDPGTLQQEVCGVVNVPPNDFPAR